MVKICFIGRGELVAGEQLLDPMLADCSLFTYTAQSADVEYLKVGRWVPHSTSRHIRKTAFVKIVHHLEVLYKSLRS